MHLLYSQRRIISHFLLGVAVGCIGLLLWPKNTIAPVPTSTPIEDSIALEKSNPTVLRIPKINVEASFEEPLGVASDGGIEVPDAFDTVGWYKHGPTPGEIGPAVVLGHVDSVSGPAVFFSLGQLHEGDKIYILRSDGSEAVFVVERLKRYPQADFPTAEVYGDIPYAGLRLITCSGTYKRGEQRYTHNLVVYAKLVE
jgi:sortase (surface protein transpeptidase)